MQIVERACERQMKRKAVSEQVICDKVAGDIQHWSNMGCEGVQG
jgi:hypothetical protein